MLIKKAAKAIHNFYILVPNLPSLYTIMSNPLVPPTDGTVTLPEAFAFHAKHNSDRTLYAFHKDGADELTNVNYFEFLRAADRVAHYIRPGRRGSEAEVMAVVALSDTLLYEAVIIGLLRAGVVVRALNISWRSEFASYNSSSRI
jgi:acyl-CoA synthetase (AMP-forming)/AMP-acid ligase II